MRVASSARDTQRYYVSGGMRVNVVIRHKIRIGCILQPDTSWIQSNLWPWPTWDTIHLHHDTHKALRHSCFIQKFLCHWISSPQWLKVSLKWTWVSPTSYKRGSLCYDCPVSVGNKGLIQSVESSSSSQQTSCAIKCLTMRRHVVTQSRDLKLFSNDCIIQAESDVIQAAQQRKLCVLSPPKMLSARRRSTLFTCVVKHRLCKMNLLVWARRAVQT